MHDAVDLLEAAIPTTGPAEMYAVTHKALASAITVIARADDSSGIIGDACRRLLDLHPGVAAAAHVPPGRLAEWMIKFQFDGEIDYFTIDPVAYAPALGTAGIAAYRERLTAIEARLPPASVADRWVSSHDQFILDWNARRLAVYDHDIDDIIATHARDRRVAAWLEDTAKAFDEIGDIDLAVEWAKQAADFDRGHQALKAAGYWCELLARHQPTDLLPARLAVFRRWPSSSTAADLHHDAGLSWPDYQAEVLATLATSPRDAVLFALLTLDDVHRAWDLAHSLGLESDDVWERLVADYQVLDPTATLPILARLVDQDLTRTGAQHYRSAARRLVTMRALAAGTPNAADIDHHIAELRYTHRRRPRLQQEFDRARLP